MRIHEFYKCRNCNEFHLVDYDMFVKSMVNVWAQELRQRNEFYHINGSVYYCPILMIHEFSNARNASEVQLIDQQYDHKKRNAISDQVFSVDQVCFFEFIRCVCKIFCTSIVIQTDRYNQIHR